MGCCRQFLVLALVLVVLTVSYAKIGQTYNNVYHSSAWTLQAELRVDEASTYGVTPVGMTGRGFVTAITGYDKTDPGIYIHTTDDGYATKGRQVWSQQAKLRPAPVTQGDDEFGKWIVSHHHTIIVSAPYATGGMGDIQTDAGAVYVFNGTLRHWTQMQKLVAADGAVGDHFGELMSLNRDRVVISAKNSKGADFHASVTDQAVGSCYVYERENGGMTWSRTSKLFAKDMHTDNYFAEKVGVFDDWVVSTARNDFETGLRSGSAYMFKQTAGKWSQQQKLMAADLVYWQPGRDVAFYEEVKGVKVFANDIALEGSVLAAGYRRMDNNEATVNGVYIFNGYENTNRWSLQQRLFTNPADEGSAGITMNATTVKMINTNNIIANVYGPNNLGNTYLFKTFGAGWSLQQALTPTEVFREVTGDKTNGLSEFRGFDGPWSPNSPAADYEDTVFEEPMMHGGTLFQKFRDINLIHSRFNDASCLLIWMSDHFLDGWDSNVLTVRAPDTSNDTFHPHCDQIDPFYVRYCPYQPEDEGVYIIKTFAAEQSRFFWELSWQVQVEATNEWYKGDYSSKMRFNFNKTAMAFSFFDAENLVDLNRPCYRCISVSTKSWLQMQQVSNEGFFPLDSWGAPWYISDLEGKNIISMGNVCDDVNHYQCYQRISEGYYVLRLGGGLFGRLTGFPYQHAQWAGCGETGNDRTQLVFKIKDGKCIPVQKFEYVSRCSRPPPIDIYADQGISAPTAGGTAAPTINVFGKPWVPYEMYAFDEDKATAEHEVVDKNEAVAILSSVQKDTGIVHEEVVYNRQHAPTAAKDATVDAADAEAKQKGQKLDAFF